MDKKNSDPIIVGFSNADFICDGTDDDIQIQAAVTLALSSGLNVEIRPGTYDISATITANVAGKTLKIVGSGMNSTLLISSITDGGHVVSIIGARDYGTEFFGISNLTITGSSTSGNGLYVADTYQGEINNVRATGCTNTSTSLGSGIHLYRSIDFIITNPIAIGCKYAGLLLDTSSNANTVVGGWLYGNTEAGLRLINGANGNTCIGVIFESNTAGDGVRVNGSTGSRYISCWFENNKRGFYSGTSAGHQVLRDCWFEKGSASKTHDVMFDNGTSYSSVVGCRVTNSTGNTGLVEIVAGAVDCSIIENHNIVTITNAGTNTKIRNNFGYITENSGTAIVANGQTSIVVAHGLSVTPTADDIMVTPTNSMGNAAKYYISTFTATEFTITVDADPGATTAIFAWKAIVL